MARRATVAGRVCRRPRGGAGSPELAGEADSSNVAHQQAACRSPARPTHPDLNRSPGRQRGASRQTVFSMPSGQMTVATAVSPWCAASGRMPAAAAGPAVTAERHTNAPYTAPGSAGADQLTRLRQADTVKLARWCPGKSRSGSFPPWGMTAGSPNTSVAVTVSSRPPLGVTVPSAHPPGRAPRPPPPLTGPLCGAILSIWCPALSNDAPVGPAGPGPQWSPSRGAHGWSPGPLQSLLISQCRETRLRAAGWQRHDGRHDITGQPHHH
jgi:hypothetical protein